MRARAMVIEKQRAGLREEPDNSQQKENIADARGEKGFLRRRRRRRLLIPESNQQVRSKSDRSPST